MTTGWMVAFAYPSANERLARAATQTAPTKQADQGLVNDIIDGMNTKLRISRLEVPDLLLYGRCRAAVAALTLAISAGGLSSCARPQPAVPRERRLPPSVSGAERYEVRCSLRKFCEQRATHLCTTGYEIESEWHDDGTAPERNELAPRPEGEGSRRWGDWLGHSPAMALTFRCHKPLQGSTLSR